MNKRIFLITLLIGLLQLAYLAMLIIFYAAYGYLLMVFSNPFNITAISIEFTIGILFILLAILFKKE